MAENRLEIRLDAADVLKAIQGLQGFDGVAQHELSIATEENIVWAHDFIAKYPPASPTSSYVRTGTLGRNWAHEVRQFSGSVRALLANPVIYAPYVQDELAQAKIHRGRWPTVQMLLRAPVKLFEARYKIACQRILRTMESRLPR